MLRCTRRRVGQSARRYPTPRRALSAAERQLVCDVLHEDRFVDKAPAQVYAALLDEEVYHCSIRTMYRILAARREVRERRDQLRHPQYQKPELLATGPNQVWSWDITKLLGPVKWTHYYLYVILDIFSRYVVGWMLALQEAARLAKRLIAESCAKQGIVPGQLTVHADRGSSMRSQGVAMLLGSLGITKTPAAVRTSPTTTRTPRRSSRRSSTARSFPTASAVPRTRAASATCSSATTTMSTGTRASGS